MNWEGLRFPSWNGDPFPLKDTKFSQKVDGKIPGGKGKEKLFPVGRDIFS